MFYMISLVGKWFLTYRLWKTHPCRKLFTCTYTLFFSQRNYSHCLILVCPKNRFKCDCMSYKAFFTVKQKYICSVFVKMLLFQSFKCILEPKQWNYGILACTYILQWLVVPASCPTHILVLFDCTGGLHSSNQKGRGSIIPLVGMRHVHTCTYMFILHI